jgi:LPXTG-motif cell wall-anchored protein
MFEKEKFDVFSPEEKRGILSKISRKNQWIIIIAILVFLAFGGYFYLKRKMNIGLLDYNISPNVFISSKPQKEKSDSGEKPANVEPAPLFGGTNYQSENFRVGDIAIGGEAEFLLTEDTSEPLDISTIRGEAFNEKNKQEVKLVLSWKTNKLAKSEIMYSKGVGQAEKTVSEDDYALNHSLIISGLDQASTYIYTIASQDRFGNSITSDPYAVYTGSRTVSLFDLIASAVGEVFGWAINKK